MTFSNATFALFLTMQSAVCVHAFWKGGAPERWVAGIMVSAVILSILTARASPYQRGDHAMFDFVRSGVALIDLAMLVSLIAVALRADRYWPIWVSALQMVAVMLHIARLVDLTMLGMVYARMETYWSYAMMLCLVIGTVRHRQRIAAGGRDRSWSVF